MQSKSDVVNAYCTYLLKQYSHLNIGSPLIIDRINIFFCILLSPELSLCNQCQKCWNVGKCGTCFRPFVCKHVYRADRIHLH